MDQEILVQTHRFASTIVLIEHRKFPFWSDTRIIPGYVASASAIVLLLRIIFLSEPVRRAYTHLLASTATTIFDRDFSTHSQSRSLPSQTADITEYFAIRGGRVTYAFKIIQMIGCLALIWLSYATASSESRKAVKWPEVVAGATYVYAFALAAFSVAMNTKWNKTVARQLNVLLLVTLGVYLYRDIMPLTTFTKVPIDISEGWTLWAKITILTLISVIIPVLTPRPYIPVDPKNPMDVPNAEQTASILSLVLFSFLDPIVFLAYRIPHLPLDRLPPLADYDNAHYLKEKHFPHVDMFSGSKRRHMFFSFLRIFRREFAVMALMTFVHGVMTLASPLAVNRLLHYIETNGAESIIRPWFWIVWLFLSPTMCSLASQWYAYLSTHILVQAECLITELVFEHSLRIRVKAEVEGDLSGVAENTSSIVAISSAEDISAEGQRVQPDDNTSRSTSPNGSSVALYKKKPKAMRGTAQPNLAERATADNLVGKINNLVTTDLMNITEAREYLVALYAPVQITLCIIFLYIFLGWSAFVGLAVIILLFPAPSFVAKLVQKVQIERSKRTDARVQTVSETMTVLRMIKMFGWEQKMNEKIAGKREDELGWIWKRKILDLITANLNYLVPMATMTATYSIYTLVMKQELNASIVFSTMTVFEVLRDNVSWIFLTFAPVVTGKVSLDRVQEFLQQTELLDSFSEKTSDALLAAKDHTNDDRVGFRDATFTWSNNNDGTLTPSRRQFTLKIDDELLFKKGCINLIIGPTGSGKTSLLMALLGEMHFIATGPSSWFNLPRDSGVAYAAQESWILNETIKDNIIFRSPFDDDRYKKVLYQCCLERDLALFEAGDQTEVGEKGLTLSGGQKARITLARAIYSNAQIILLDDVLAALDVHTAKWIVEKCLTGDLIQGRTILLVTHNVALTRPIAGYVVSMGIDGNILIHSSVSEALIIDSILADETEKDQQVLEKVAEEIDSPLATEAVQSGKLITAEEIEEGHVGWAAQKLYFAGLGGRHPLFFFLVAAGGLLSTEVVLALQTWYLGHWASQYENRPASEVSVPHYLGVFVALFLLGIFVYCSAHITYLFGSIRASRTIHKQLVESVLGTTLRWLDITPTSRILTRCTQDIGAVDGPISHNLWFLSEITSTIIIKFLAVVLFTPIFVIPGVFIAVLGSWCGQVYIASQLSVKREMSNAKAPVLGHFGAAISGLISIRAYGAQNSFIQTSLDRINVYSRTARTFYNLNRWVGVRIQVMGGLFAAALGIYLVYFQSKNASTTGFSLNMAVGFSGVILYWVRVFNDFEVSCNSLERLRGFIRIEQEPKPTDSGVPPAYWPSSGNIAAENLSAKYSPDGPKVLHNISFNIKSGERVGVVGRTGSGKSSLTLSLLRCILTEGNVYYDGIKTDSINLDALRSSITIIPQIPELLGGTLRQNLDPFEQYDDARLNDALRSAGLFALQSDMEDSKLTLDSSISGGGSNLSVGQRQIIALARATVRGSKLLILDEATSAIDYKTDSIIQSSLRHELGGDVTLITVAHRLQTIMDADKIMVLDAGHLVEFDSPQELLKINNGKLRSLVDESGDKEILYAMAVGKSTQ